MSILHCEYCTLKKASKKVQHKSVCTRKSKRTIMSRSHVYKMTHFDAETMRDARHVVLQDDAI